MAAPVFGIALVVLAVVMAVASPVVVRQGYGTPGLGTCTTTRRPGLLLIVPFIARVGRRINRMAQVPDIPAQEFTTRDTAVVAVDGMVFDQVLKAA
ncbi:hypothetical protein [Thermaurantiacus sp.]